MPASVADKEAKLLAEIDAFGRGRTPTAEDLQVGLAGHANNTRLAVRTPGSAAIAPAPLPPSTLLMAPSHACAP